MLDLISEGNFDLNQKHIYPVHMNNGKVSKVMSDLAFKLESFVAFTAAQIPALTHALRVSEVQCSLCKV
jgi:hypothetical protein